MGAADLDDVVEGFDLGLESVAEGSQCGEQSILELKDSSDVHDGRERIVRGSGHVDVIVRVNGLLAAHFASEDLNCAVGDDLVGVHVGLGAGASLPDDEGEVVDELEGGDFSGSLLDCLRDFGVEAELDVDFGGSALEDTECLDDWRGHAVLGLIDLEVAEGAVGGGGGKMEDQLAGLSSRDGHSDAMTYRWV